MFPPPPPISACRKSQIAQQHTLMVQMHQHCSKFLLLTSFYGSQGSLCTCPAGAVASNYVAKCVLLSGNGCSASDIKTWIFLLCTTATRWQHLEQKACGKGTKLGPKYSWLRRNSIENSSSGSTDPCLWKAFPPQPPPAHFRAPVIPKYTRLQGELWVQKGKWATEKEL